MSAASPRPFLGWRLSLVGLVFVAACSPFGQAAPQGPSTPSTTKGAVAFSPPDGATDLDPARVEVLVRPSGSGAELKSVSVQAEGGYSLPSTLQNGRLSLKDAFKTDSRYVMTATAVVHHKDAPDEEQTQTSAFQTASTPKIVATNPKSVGQGQSVVLTLEPAAASIVVDGPVKAELAPDGLTVTVVPQSFEQGQTYSFRIKAKSKSGVEGEPQAASFNTLAPGTASVYPSAGSSNMGVAIPLTVTLSDPPADRAAFVAHLSVSAQLGSTPVVGAGSCAGYGVPTVAGGSLPVSASWVTDRRVRLTPKTPDGYWPAKSTMTLSAQLTNLSTVAGNTFTKNLTSTFVTGEKRVIDVDLGSQNLTACKNGTQDNQFLISSGTPAHATATGSFYIYSRVADEEMKSPEGPFAPDFYDIKHVPWTQYFDGGAALHGAWWHNNFGHPMSHGCVNIQDPTQNTKWPNAAPQAQYLWNFDNLGDPVVVHGVTPGLTAATQPSD